MTTKTCCNRCDKEIIDNDAHGHFYIYGKNHSDPKIFDLCENCSKQVAKFIVKGESK